MHYWLLKSEPDVFGIDALANAPRRTTGWEGVRNYQARNMLRDDFRKGDRAFFYHSSCEVPGVAGVVKVVREAYPDPTQFDAKSEYHDAGSTREAPRWFSVDVQLEKRFEPVITLPELREHAAGALREMLILKRGNRLSVTPLTAEEWRCIVALRPAVTSTRATKSAAGLRTRSKKS
ncbi:MAG: EVE domain-containing protein [Proteobacteria bacterium]|nr:EVE domain-containing protein [Pseudomonadota bacterium]